MTLIRLYVDGGTLLAANLEAQKIRTINTQYVLIDGVLYRRGYSSSLLRCVNLEEGNYLLRKIHQGICNAQEGSRSIAHKALCLGYYWPTVQSDAMELVKKCLACQRHSRVSHLSPSDL